MPSTRMEGDRSLGLLEDMYFGQARLRRIDCLLWTECGDSSCNWLTYSLVFVRYQSNWCQPAVPNGITSCLLSDPGTMARGRPVGQSTAAVSLMHAAKLTGYNQAGKTGPGLEALWWLLPLHTAKVDISCHAMQLRPKQRHHCTWHWPQQRSFPDWL